MIETLEHPHLTPHALLIPLLRNGLECDLVRDVLRRRRGGGIWRSREGGGVAGSELGVAVGDGMDEPAARRPARV